MTLRSALIDRCDQIARTVMDALDEAARLDAWAATLDNLDHDDRIRLQARRDIVAFTAFRALGQWHRLGGVIELVLPPELNLPEPEPEPDSEQAESAVVAQMASMSDTPSSVITGPWTAPPPPPAPPSVPASIEAIAALQQRLSGGGLTPSVSPVAVTSYWLSKLGNILTRAVP